MRSKFSPEWRQWIKTNIKSGQDKTYIFNILIDEGFSYNATKREMNFEPTLKHVFNDDWIQWITSNIEGGQDKNGLFKVLLTHGYAYDAIAKQMQYEPTIPLDQLVDPFNASSKNLTTSEPTLSGTSTSERDLFIPNADR